MTTDVSELEAARAVAIMLRKALQDRKAVARDVVEYSRQIEKEPQVRSNLELYTAMGKP